MPNIQPDHLKEGHTYTLVGIRGKKVTNVEKDLRYEGKKKVEGKSKQDDKFVYRFIDNKLKNKFIMRYNIQILQNAFWYEEYHYDDDEGIDYGYKFYNNNDRDIPEVGDTIRAGGGRRRARTHSRYRSKTRRSGSKTRRSKNSI